MANWNPSCRVLLKFINLYIGSNVADNIEGILAIDINQGLYWLELGGQLDGKYDSSSTWGDELCLDYGYTSRISDYGSWIDDLVGLPDDNDNNSDDNNSNDNNLNTRSNASQVNRIDKLSKTDTTLTYNPQVSIIEKFISPHQLWDYWYQPIRIYSF